jgi:DNA-directed RNA polymerase I, II, and III subunit RPABC2
MNTNSDDEISVSSLVSNQEVGDPEIENIDSENEDSDDDVVPPPPSYPPPPENDSDEELEADLDLQSDIEEDASIEEADGRINPMMESSEYGSDYGDSDSDSDDDDNYLQKLDNLNKQNIIQKHHPELLQHNHYEIEALTQIIRNEQGIIVDPLHKTLPFITKYEKARILGERAKQLNMGAKPLVEIGSEVIDGYLIACKEFTEKKIPFIIKRPMPNGGCEYWKFKDFEII